MFERTVSADDLARFHDARTKADAAYHDALATLDAARQRLFDLPAAPPANDEQLVDTLNAHWDLASRRPTPSGGWRGRLQAMVWALVAPLFDQQHAFNAALVDHINRNLAREREQVATLQTTLEALRGILSNLTAFELLVVSYAQQVTPYVDTKIRETNGIMRRINEDVTEANVGLTSSVKAIALELRQRWETTLARERRLDARMDDLEATASVAHQAAQALKRELGRTIQPASPPAPAGVSAPAAPDEPLAVDDHKYLGFEDVYRGAPDEIRARLTAYLPAFDGATDVLDVGCGRGEFLDLLRERGIEARGIDINHEMVEQCRAQGLAVERADLRRYLRDLPDGSLGGLFAAQVVEHLEPAYLLETLDLAFHKLRPGSTMILETINVASWSAFFQAYIRDITHVRPLHPDTLRYFVTASGFQRIEVMWRSPCAPEQRLEAVTVPDNDTTPRQPGDLATLTAAFNSAVDKLNRLLFADRDYAVVAKRL